MRFFVPVRRSFLAPLDDARGAPQVIRNKLRFCADILPSEDDQHLRLGTTGKRVSVTRFLHSAGHSSRLSAPSDLANADSRHRALVRRARIGPLGRGHAQPSFITQGHEWIDSRRAARGYVIFAGVRNVHLGLGCVFESAIVDIAKNAHNGGPRAIGRAHAHAF